MKSINYLEQARVYLIDFITEWEGTDKEIRGAIEKVCRIIVNVQSDLIDKNFVERNQNDNR